MKLEIRDSDIEDAREMLLGVIQHSEFNVESTRVAARLLDQMDAQLPTEPQKISGPGGKDTTFKAW